MKRSAVMCSVTKYCSLQGMSDGHVADAGDVPSHICSVHTVNCKRSQCSDNCVLQNKSNCPSVRAFVCLSVHF